MERLRLGAEGLAGGLKYKPEVWLLVETWHKELDTEALKNLLRLLGYRLHSQPRLGRNGGGVAIYVRWDIPSTRIGLSQYSTWDNLNRDKIQIVSARVELFGRQHLITCLYRPGCVDLAETKSLCDFLCEHWADWSWGEDPEDPRPIHIFADINLGNENFQEWLKNGHLYHVRFGPQESKHKYVRRAMEQFNIRNRVLTSTRRSGTGVENILDVYCSNLSLQQLNVAVLSRPGTRQASSDHRTVGVALLPP